MFDEHARRLALWRYEIIAPLLGLQEAPRGSLRAALGRLAARTYQHPEHGPVRFAWGTLEGWLYDYRQHGREGLEPDGRALLAELRAADPERALPSLSTLYRFLRSRGLDQRRAPVRRDHRAYAFDLAGDCWQGDIIPGSSSLPGEERDHEPLPERDSRQTQRDGLPGSWWTPGA